MSCRLNMSGSFFCVKIYVALPSGCSEIWYQQNQTRFWFLVTVLPTTILQLRRAISLRHVHTNSNATTFTHHLASLAGASLRRTSSWHSWINHVESKIHGKSSVLKSCLNCMYIYNIIWYYKILYVHKYASVIKWVYTSSTAQGGGGSFKNRKPIGEIGCCESGMAERSHWWTERCLISLTLSLSFSGYLPTHPYIFYVSIYLSYLI